MITCLLLTAATGVQGARLAKQGDPPGAVPIETGTEPAPETPPQARRLQRSIDSLGGFNLLADTGLLALKAFQDRLAYARPPAGRALRRWA